ncbi:phenylacetate--CoA ligase family protein [Pseudonocardia sp. CA-107938]|uniref:phenylacetate--CoA ligase family protein n=1 Tax=Pseudonocardia sp. CA-107938 TaxID=3240021 RepID=UPI003D8E98B6
MSDRRFTARARTTALVLGVLASRHRLRRRDSWSRAQLLDHQTRALADLRSHAYSRSAFYRGFHAGLHGRPLSELPVLTKSLLMERFDELVTAPDVQLAGVERYLAGLHGEDLYRGRYYVAATAGTTGRRGVFVWNFAEWRHVVASYNRAFDWAGSTAGLTHQVRTAVVSSTNPTHQSARVGASIHSRWVPTLRLDAGDDLASIVTRLTEWQPDMLIGYASMLRLLAEEQLAGRLRIAPRFVFSASEVLTDSTRQLATAAWATAPRNVYGATETSGIAAECGHHPGLHLFEDLVITEVVDEDNQPVPPGEWGAKVLVTVLFSRTLPLIRYEMTDSVQLARHHDCPCGRPYALLTGIQGREQEALRFPTGAGPTRVVQPVVFHHVMDRVSAAGWQIVQRPDGLDVLLAHPRRVDPLRLAAALRTALAEHGVTAPEIRIQHVSAIPRTALGKAPLITTAAARPAGPPTAPMAGPEQVG